MYKELREFIPEILRDKAVYKDGELWTAVVAGVFVGCWCSEDPEVIPKIREHFGDLLTVVSIVFGFVLTAMFFHVETAEAWTNDPRVEKVAKRLINWDVWSVLCFLLLLSYIVAVWAFAPRLPPYLGPMLYGFMGFLSVYCGCQIVNQTLLLRWAFLRRHILKNDAPPSTGVLPAPPPSIPHVDPPETPRNG